MHVHARGIGLCPTITNFLATPLMIMTRLPFFHTMFTTEDSSGVSKLCQSLKVLPDLIILIDFPVDKVHNELANLQRDEALTTSTALFFTAQY